jgi:hypothetical protein
MSDNKELNVSLPGRWELWLLRLILVLLFIGLEIDCDLSHDVAGQILSALGIVCGLLQWFLEHRFARPAV